MTIQQTIFLCVRYKLPNTKRHTKYSKSSSVSKPSNVQKRSKLPAREYLPSVRQFFYSKFLYPVSNFHKKSNCQLQARRRVRSATVPGSWAPESPLPHRRAFIPWRNDYSDRLQRYAFTPPYFRSNRLWSGNYSSAACAVSGKLWCKWRRRGWEGGGRGSVAARWICNIEQKRWIYWTLVYKMFCSLLLRFRIRRKATSVVKCWWTIN